MPFIDASAGGAVNVRPVGAWLVINGLNLPCDAATVTRKSERTADTFSAEIPVEVSAKFGMGLAEWADYQPSVASVTMSTGGGPQTMISGMIDQPTINWLDMTITVSGRDGGGTLSETRRSQKFVNQKSSDIVSTIAQDHGLTALATAGADFAGKLYTQDTNHLVLNRSDHEVLSDLAEREGFRWYVDGSNLVFEPKGTQKGTFSLMWCPPGAAAPYAVASFTDLKTSRNMTAAKPHTMNVNSWNHKDKQKYVGTASAGGIGSDIVVDHQHNGKTQAQSDNLANARVADAIRHDCNIQARCPADLSVDARQQVALSGTGTIYDQFYAIDSVEFDYKMGDGIEMQIDAKTAKAGR